MDTFKKNKLVWFIILCVSVLPVRAGVLSELSELVEPGGVEIPAIVSVLGPEESNDVNNVKEIFRTINSSLKDINVQFNVKWIKTGITEIGDGDRKLSEDEFNGILLRSVFELGGLPRVENDSNDTNAGSNREDGRPRIGKGIKFNIADDVWEESPDVTFWYDRFYPVAFLELTLPPQQLSNIVVQQVGFAAGLSPSTDPSNRMYPDGTGTLWNESQGIAIREFTRKIGYVRSSLAEGYSQDILADLRFKRSGALFHPEVFTIRGDYRDDVKIEDIDGSRIGSSGVDLEAYIARIDGIGESSVERSLVLKYYLANTELPENIYFDTYLRIPDYLHCDDVNESLVDTPWDFFGAAIGAALTSSGAYVGVSNYLDNSDFQQLIGLQPEVSNDLGRTKVKIEIPLSLLISYLPDSLSEYLINGREVESLATSNSIIFDSLGGIRFEDDYIEKFKIDPKPELPQVTAEYSYDGIDPTTLSFGWDVVTWILEEDSNDLDKHDRRKLLSQPFSGSEAGRVVLPRINLNTSLNNDSFNSATGFPNDSYPGIDLSGLTNLRFLTEGRALVELVAGLYIFSLQGKDTAILKIGPVNVGSLFHYNHDMQDGIDHESDSDTVNGLPPYKGNWSDNHLSVLQRGDTVFEVKDPGLYLLTVRSLSQISAVSDEDVNETSGASLEAQQVLQDGTRVLLGDVLPVYVPPAGIDVPNMPDIPDVPNGTDELFDDFETGDFSRLPWTFGGDTGWIIGTSERHSGAYSARSGSITDDETTTLEVTLQTGTGEVSFWRNVSSENGFDFLRFYIDSELKDEWSGELDWEQVSYQIGNGQHTFEWSYGKDNSVSSGEDAAWFDDVLFP